MKKRSRGSTDEALATASVKSNLQQLDWSVIADMLLLYGSVEIQTTWSPDGTISYRVLGIEEILTKQSELTIRAVTVNPIKITSRKLRKNGKG